jgi:crotonobetainyl-CoA:carnitine CoA-transferase CaiB-like acyl-CoA transferase
MAMTGTKDVNPIKLGSPAVDYGTGMTGAFALSAALYQRERTGKGQRIDMAMLDVAMILMASHVTGYLRNGVHPKPSSNRHPHATVQDQRRHAGHAGGEQHPPAEAAVDPARPPRDDQEDQRRA